MTAPFAKNSISLRLYPHNELTAQGVVKELCTQAKIALDHGFDGIMVSEHHGGVGGYFCNPMQMVGFILEENDTGWGAACPMLLPLRPTAQVAEEVAWLNARHPGRVGLGVGSGGKAEDFIAMDLDPASAVPKFKAELPRIIDMLRGKDLHGLDQDLALQDCAQHPIPVMSAAASSVASRRAAGYGAGILMEGVSSTERLARFCRAYDEAGGTDGKSVVRRVWLGPPLESLIESQRAFYASFRRDGTVLPADQTIAVLDPSEMVDRLHAVMTGSGADQLNIRVHLPGIPAKDIREQIQRLAEEVVPPLRAKLAAS